jgi:hypothetical protein
MGKGGGGSAPAPVQQTVNNTSIPAYAQPYVESMLGQTQALTDINQNPYQTYGGERIAAFTPMQARSFQNVANQKVAGQIGTGSDLATVSGLGSIGTANQLGQAGNQYQRNATSMYGPGSVGDYMNPYLAQSLSPQLNLLAQQYGMKGAQEAGAATSAGAFGGSRNALMQGLNQQNQLLSQQKAIGEGYNTAFQNAQQAQQFGANLGLQGLQGQMAGYGQAAQAGNTLNSLGQQQYAQETGINQAQQQAGAVQQAQAQQGLDMSYNDFLNQKNYPYTQLAFMSDMTRGIPLSQSAQSVYKAPANLGSQLGGLGMTALGIYGQSQAGKGVKEGGVIKGMKAGGLAYQAGGDIKMMDTKQLTELLRNPTLNPIEVAQIQKELMLRKRMENNPQTAEIMGSGIDSIPTGDMVPENMAGGGIIAFAKGGDPNGVDAIKSASQSRQSYRDQLEREVLDSMKRLSTEDPFKESRAQDEQIRAQIAKSQRVSPYEALTMAGVKTLAGTSPDALVNLGAGGVEGMEAYARSGRNEADLQKQLLQQGVEREKAQFGRQTQLLGAQQTALGQLYNKDAALAAANAGVGDKNMIKAQALMGSDPVIKSLEKQLIASAAQPGSPEYDYYEQRIAERQNQIYAAVGVKAPEIAPSKIAFPKPEEKPGFFDKIFGSSKPAASQNKVVPFSQLPTKG